MNKMAANIGLKGICEITVFKPDGDIRDKREFHNDITNVGFDQLFDILGAAAQPDQISHIGIGWGVGANTAFAATQTDLQGASSDRKAAAYYHDIGDKDFRFIIVWGPNEPLASTVPIEESGVFNAAAAGIMLNRKTFPVLNKQKEDTVEVKWTFTFSQV